VFDQLFGAAMKQADVGIDASDDLTVKLQHKEKHPVRRGVLGAKIDGEITKACFRHGDLTVAR
jgi:hypothetical protein